MVLTTSAGVTLRMSAAGMTFGVTTARITCWVSRGRMGGRSGTCGRRVIGVGACAAGLTTLVHGGRTRVVGMLAAGVTRGMYAAGLTALVHGGRTRIGMHAAGVTRRMRASGITGGTFAAGVARGMHASRVRAAGCRHGVVYRTPAGPDVRSRGRVTLGAEMTTAYPVHRGYGWPAMVGGRIGGPVGAERMVMVELFGGRLYVVFARKRLFLRRRLAVDAARAVKA